MKYQCRERNQSQVSKQKSSKQLTMGSKKSTTHPTSSKPSSSPTIRISTFLSATLLFASFLLFTKLINLVRLASPPGIACNEAPPATKTWAGDLREAKFAWNKLCFGDAGEKLKLAVFSKKWPVNANPGGMERHAYTLYKELAAKGHSVHVFTVPSDGRPLPDVVDGNLYVHFAPNEVGVLNNSLAFEKLLAENAIKTFDFIHTESVALPHWRARNVPNLAVTWHGIAYESLHSRLIQDLLWESGQNRSPESDLHLRERLPRLLEEIRFFSRYNHHICISDSAGEILVNIYQLPRRNVHVILNGVDHEKFVYDPESGARFREEFGVPANASLVMGLAGRLVKDKGHPLLFEAFSVIRKLHPSVFLLIAGSGPWEDRYRDLEPNVKVLGALDPSKLSEFYNAIDIFLNPTLRPQGLDLTLMEAMQCGKPLLVTNFPSITGSVIVNDGFGYTFSPNVKSLVESLELAIKDGRKELQSKGMACKDYAMSMFTATKMASAYERFFLCMKDNKYCQYPLATDC